MPHPSVPHVVLSGRLSAQTLVMIMSGRPATQAPVHTSCSRDSRRAAPATSTGIVSTSHTPIASASAVQITFADPGPPSHVGTSPTFDLATGCVDERKMKPLSAAPIPTHSIDSHQIWPPAPRGFDWNRYRLITLKI